MPWKADIPPTDPTATGYWVDKPIVKKFLKKPKFRLYLQEYLRNLLSSEIKITLQQPPPIEKDWHTKTFPSGYMIQLLDINDNKTEMEQTLSDFCKKFFDTINSKIYKNGKVKQWLSYSPAKVEDLQCIESIMDEKLREVFTICENERSSLKIYYLTKEPFSACDGAGIDQIIESEIFQETILLRLPYEQSRQIESELLAQSVENKDVSIHFVFVRSARMDMQQKIILFGYSKTVNRLKEELLEMIEKRNVITFKLTSLDKSQIEYLCKTCSSEMKEITRKYEDFGVDLRLRLNEFSAPEHLKNKIESRIVKLLSQSTTKTFKSIHLWKDIAQKEEKHLHCIAHRNHCFVKTELSYKSRCYTIPKASSSTKNALKSVMEQSNQFCSSCDVFNKINVANGSIEIRTGDIALQKVDIIVISTSPDGLKEGVIERAGVFSYERTYTDTTGVKFTETNGANLNCKRILFSNWMPHTITNDESEYRKSIQFFISKSIEYAVKDNNPTSVAFAVPDSNKDETILAQEMIAEAKRQLELRNTELRISFILLAKQQTLLNQLFFVGSAMQDIYAQFEWPIAVVKTTLITSDADYMTKCQEKFNNYLIRCSTSLKVINPSGIFHYWDQYMINTFYKYCKDKCVLPQIDRTKTELELNGPVSCVHEVKRKWHLLSELANEKASRTLTTERSSSAAGRSERLGARSTIAQAKVYNIMLSYSERDTRFCQRLINRLIEEGFSVWAEPVIGEQHRDVSSQMDKSDCILLCVSENYYESLSCEKEARYAFQTGKPVFPVKIQNHPLIGWQREIFEEKFFFQFFGSENHFDLECCHLLLNILRCTKPGYNPLLQRISTRGQQDNDELQSLITIEHRRSIYDEKIRALMKTGHIQDKEMKKLIKQLQDVLLGVGEESNEPDKQNDTTNNDQPKPQPPPKEFSECIQRWLKKPTNITKQNLPPFSATGDINDAPFPMPEYVAKYLNLHVQLSSGTRPFPVKLRNAFECDIIIRPVEQPFTRALFNPIVADDERIYGKCTQKLELFVDSPQASLNRFYSTDFSAPKKANLPLLPPDTSVLRKRRKLDNQYKIKDQREELVKKSNKKKYEHPSREALGIHLERFAQRMKENATEFEKFCSTAAGQ